MGRHCRKAIFKIYTYISINNSPLLFDYQRLSTYILGKRKTKFQCSAHSFPSAGIMQLDPYWFIFISAGSRWKNTHCIQLKTFFCCHFDMAMQLCILLIYLKTLLSICFGNMLVRHRKMIKMNEKWSLHCGSSKSTGQTDM